MSDSIKRSLKSAGRAFVFGFIGSAAGFVLVVINQPLISWRTLVVGLISGGLTGGLRGLDKWLHESGVAEKGLARF